MNQKQAKELVRSRLSDKRYEHTLNVRKMAVKLAKHHDADEDRPRWLPCCTTLQKRSPRTRCGPS